MAEEAYTLEQLDILTLQPHPGQPPTRTLDTTEIQDSIKEHGYMPAFRIKVAQDSLTVLDGWRRTTALKALHEQGHTEYRNMVVEVWDIDPNSAEAFIMLRTANNNRPHTKTQLLFTGKAMAEKLDGMDLYKALVRIGVAAPCASLLAKLDRYDRQLDGKLLKAMERHERTRKGLSWTAWREGSGQTVAWWKERLGLDDDAALDAKSIKRTRKAELSQQAELPVSAGNALDLDAAMALVNAAKAHLGQVLSFAQNGATELDKDDLTVVLQPLVQTVLDIKKEVA